LAYLCSSVLGSALGGRELAPAFAALAQVAIGSVAAHWEAGTSNGWIDVIVVAGLVNWRDWERDWSRRLASAGDEEVFS
jgi:hypothetical protein